jgi:hypothetical protein
MRPRSIPSLIVGLVVALSSRPAPADDLKADVSAGKRLLAEGDALADKNEPTEAVHRYKRAFEQLLPGLRKLPFKHAVKGDVTAREALRAVLLKEIEEDKTPAEFRADEMGMKALGLIPRDLDLKETMIKVYSEEIAAFYDTKTETMHLIKEPAAEANKKPSLFERLLGKTGGFDKDENKTVIAHELTHALADQNFDIDALQDDAKGDDDRDLALSALVEGEATLTMIGAQMEDWDGSITAQLPAENLELTFRILGPFLPMMGGGKSIREAPPILVESMIFPYLRGMVFCAFVANKGGWPALTAAYRQPPLSTEQVLHPEKYREKPDPPTAVDLGALDAGPGWKELGRNVVGEMQLAVLLRRHGGKAAAEGWDGDTFAVFEGPEDRLGLVWLTTWDTEADAREFIRGYLRFQADTKFGPEVPKPDTYPESSSRRPNKGAVFAVERRGSDVAVVEGFPSEATERLIEAAFKARKTEKTHAPARPKKQGDLNTDHR